MGGFFETNFLLFLVLFSITSTFFSMEPPVNSLSINIFFNLSSNSETVLLVKSSISDFFSLSLVSLTFFLSTLRLLGFLSLSLVSLTFFLSILVFLSIFLILSITDNQFGNDILETVPM